MPEFIATVIGNRVHPQAERLTAIVYRILSLGKNGQRILVHEKNEQGLCVEVKLEDGVWHVSDPMTLLGTSAKDAPGVSRSKKESAAGWSRQLAAMLKTEQEKGIPR